MNSKNELAALFADNPFRDFLHNFSQEQIAFKPEPDVWSLLEILEHVAMVESNRLKGAATENPSEETKIAEPDFIANAMRDRSRKVKAPSFLLPAGKIDTAEAALAEIDEIRRDLLNWLKTVSEEKLAETTIPHPMLGPMTRAGWLVFVAEHSARHLEQMKELAAREDFPKN